MNRILVNLTGEAITIADDETPDGDPITENVWREVNAWRDEQALKMSNLGYHPLEHGVMWDWDESHRYAVDYYAIVETWDSEEDVWDILADVFVGVETLVLGEYE